MYLNFCQFVAPSTDAASYCSVGIARRAATKMRVQNGNDFQMCANMDNDKAKVGSFNQFGPSVPVSLKIKVLMTPHSGFNMNRIERIVGMEGTAHGNMKINDNHLIHVRLCTKKPDKNSANSIFKLMPTARKIMVFTTVR